MSKLNLVTKACAVFLLWAAAAVALPAQTAPVSPPVPTVTFTTLFTFGVGDGEGPWGLVQGPDGNLYGTTYDGNGAQSTGTVFKITPSGAFTSLGGFACGPVGCTDGTNPAAGLVLGTDGNFYGTASEGGHENCHADEGCGTIYAITPAGMMTALHLFDRSDGSSPRAPLIQATNGNLYGTTYRGTPNGDGTVFRITLSGMFTTLHSFDGTDGVNPDAGLVQGTDANLYGTTYGGGTNDEGTVFEITPDGKLTTLYNFCSQANCTDGDAPFAGLVQATDGNFYGTTYGGGTNNDGTVFKITPTGMLTTLHSFDGPDGASPEAGLIQGTDGNFYGTTAEGGVRGDGTVFQITSGGMFTTLHSFDSPNGANPEAGLIQGTDGNFYGTTFYGGTENWGTIFSLSVGLGPFVETNPVAGKVGAKVGILGTNLTGATSVTFNGTAAVFKVRSETLILAEVPSGATTGTVQVQLPGGALSSNVPFIVLQ